LIITIAIGIVLAVIALALLPYILIGAFWLLVGAIGLVVLALGGGSIILGTNLGGSAAFFYVAVPLSIAAIAVLKINEAGREGREMAAGRG
jgi:hypothetical protein